MDSKTETVSDNELVARFMGHKLRAAMGTYWLCEDPEFFDYRTDKVWVPNRDWNQLMPVVQKIYKLYEEFDFQSIKDENIFLDVLDNPVKYPISDTYRKAVECIKFINSQPHK